MADTVTVDAVLCKAQRELGRASESAAGESRWSPACNYLALSGRIAQHRERLQIWPEETLPADLLWSLSESAERLADTAQREDWPELDALTELEAGLIDLALWTQRREERGL
jgi:hypothetical protein